MKTERGRGLVVLGVGALALVILNARAAHAGAIDPYRGVNPSPRYGPPTPDGGPPCGCRPH